MTNRVIATAQEAIAAGDGVEIDLKTGKAQKMRLDEPVPYFAFEKWGVWFRSRVTVRAEFNPASGGTNMQITALGEQQTLLDLKQLHKELGEVIEEIEKRRKHGEEEHPCDR